MEFGNGNISGSSFYNTPVFISLTGGSQPPACIVYLNNNFWNSSKPTYNITTPAKATVYCDTWLVPTLITDNASGPVQVIRLVYMAFNGTDYSYYDVSKVPIFDVNATFSVSDGIINPNTGILTTDGLSADYTYEGVGDQVVTATLSDGTVLKLNVSFYRIDTFINMTVSSDIIQTGDYITINVVVRDKNGKLVNGTVNVYINSVLKGTIKLVNGVGSLKLLMTNKGTYEIFVNYTGTLDESDSSNMTIVSVKDTVMDVIVSDVDYDENATLTIKFDHDITDGYVDVTVNGKTYRVAVSGNSAEITLPILPAGKYDVSVSYNGVVNKTTTFTVSENMSPILIVDNIIMFYHDGTRFVAVLTDYQGKPIANATIYFTINGITYKRTTDRNGSASMALNLNAGSYAATVKYNNIIKNVTVTIKSTVEAADIIKMYQNGTQFFAKFFDKNGKLLANTNVTFNINGVFYTRETNKDGVARLAINLRPGKYMLTAINPVNGEEQGFNITVRSLIEADDLTKYFQNASKFEATIYNKDGSLAVNKDVTFNINGVFYKRTTNDKGVVSLAINLRPGTYTITTMYDGLEMGNKVNVLPTLETKDLSMKFQDGSKFTAKTVDGQGKPLANQNVTFNVNGVFYHRVSDANGIASLNINLIPGEYVITSIWNNFQTGNKITIA